MTRTREQIAPEPTPDTATAENVALHHTAEAVAWTVPLARDGNVQAAIAWTVGSFAVAFLLREFAKINQDAADEAARALVRLEEDPQGAHELAWEWLADYGVDGDELLAAAEVEIAERAEARKAVSS